jgi:hypothetical protein
MADERPITSGDLRALLRRAAELAEQAGDHERAEWLRWRITMMLPEPRSRPHGY